MDDPVAIVLVLAMIIESIVLHEVAHGYVAYLLGDYTAKSQGRLTLNPIKHIDPFMTILLPIMLYYGSHGRFVFGGAKPVPIRPVAMTKTSMRKGMMLTAIAGPLTNITIGIVLSLLLLLIAIVAKPLGKDPNVMLAGRVLPQVIMMNFVLAFFNMIPIPPLDGSRVLNYFLPRDLSQKMDQLEMRYGIMLFFGFYLIDRFADLGIIDKIAIQPAFVLWELIRIGINDIVNFIQ